MRAAHPIETSSRGLHRSRHFARELSTLIRLSLHAAWRGVVGVYDSEDLTFASSIAYYALLSLFPFFLIAFAVLGSVAAGDQERVEVLRFVLRYFPRQFDFVTTQLDALRTSTVPLGVAGTLVMTWAALGVFGAITSAVNHAWGVEKAPSYFKHKLISFLMLVAAGLLLLLALILVSAAGVVQARWFAAIAHTAPGFTVLRSFLVRYATTLLLIVVVGLVYYFVPNAKVRFRDVWVGAVLTGLLWNGALDGFSWYLRDLSRFSVHGSIGAVVAFLLWVYISAVILLYGVEFTAAYARLRRHRPEQAPAAPAPRT